MPFSRDYAPLLAAAPLLTTDAAMRDLVDRVWTAFGDGTSGGVSWVGFYLWSRTSPDEMVLGYRRDKPACSPIGLHGACGRCFTSRNALVVTDVAHLGAGYIACDPRDRSEVVLPCLNPDGSCYAVLDIDSHETNAFNKHDAHALMKLLRHADLSASAVPYAVEVV